MSRTTDADAALVSKVTDYVQIYMQQYDGSHDYNHILRVLGLARTIAAASPALTLDSHVITLAALLHDVGDRKYLKPGQDGSTMVQKLLVELGADEGLAAKIQFICSTVSYSSEIKDRQKVRDAIELYPELAVVQDADRLDAIGAVGIGRCFTFGGSAAGKGRGMDNTLEHFDDKLVLLEGMMKTDEGRRLARVRTERLRVFQDWWAEELGIAQKGVGL